MSCTILIADDNPGVRRSHRAYIENNSDGDVCAEAQDGAEAVEKAKQLQPDVVILDFKMPILDGLRAAAQIKSFAPATKIILYTSHDCRPMMDYAQIFGVDELVPKSDAGTKLLASIRSPKQARSAIGGSITVSRGAESEND